MMNFSLAALLLIGGLGCLLAACNLQSAEATRNKSREWLANELTVHVKSEELDQNFAWIRSILNGKSRSSQQAISAMDEAKLKLDLDMFVALQPLAKEPKCDQAELDLLVYNNKANGGRAYERLNDLSHLDRVDKISHRVMVEHAQLCRPIHLARLADYRASLSPQLELAVGNICDPLLRRSAAARSDSLMEKRIIERYLIPALRRSAQNDGDLSALSTLVKSKYSGTTKEEHAQDKAKVKRLIKKHLIEPCSEFTQKMDDFFHVALFDDHMIPLDIDENSTESRQFGLTRGRFFVCLAIQGKQTARDQKVSKSSTTPLERFMIKTIMQMNKVNKAKGVVPELVR